MHETNDSITWHVSGLQQGFKMIPKLSKLCQYDPNISKYDPNMTSRWYQDDPNMRSRLSQNDSTVIPNWLQKWFINYPAMIQVKAQNDSNMTNNVPTATFKNPPPCLLAQGSDSNVLLRFWSPFWSRFWSHFESILEPILGNFGAYVSLCLEQCFFVLSIAPWKSFGAIL